MWQKRRKNLIGSQESTSKPEQAVKTFSSSVDKLLVLKETLANKDAAEHGRQLTASLEELQSLQKQNEDLKGNWVSKLAALPSSVSPSAASDGKKQMSWSNWRNRWSKTENSCARH